MRNTLLAILLLTATSASANPTLQGVWEIASTSYDDEVITLREPRQIKIFTSRRVIYTYYFEVSAQQLLTISPWVTEPTHTPTAY